MSPVVIGTSTTSSQAVTATSTPVPPVITVNGSNVQPEGSPEGPSGFQLLVYDTTQTIGTSSSILVNQWLPVYPNGTDWTATYGQVYVDLNNFLLLSGNPNNQLMVLVSYGLDRCMGPSFAAMQMLFNYGAGAQLQNWMSGLSVVPPSGGVVSPGSGMPGGTGQLSSSASTMP